MDHEQQAAKFRARAIELEQRSRKIASLAVELRSTDRATSRQLFANATRLTRLAHEAQSDCDRATYRQQLIANAWPSVVHLA